MLERGASVAVGEQAWEPIERALQMRLPMLPSSLAAASSQAFKAAGSATSTALPKPLGALAANDFTGLPTSSAFRAQIATLAPSSANNVANRKANALAAARHERALSLQAESPLFPT